MHKNGERLLSCQRPAKVMNNIVKFAIIYYCICITHTLLSLIGMKKVVCYPNTCYFLHKHNWCNTPQICVILKARTMKFNL